MKRPNQNIRDSRSLVHCLCDCCIRYSVCLQARTANIKVTVLMNAGDFTDIYSRKQ